MIRSRRGLLSLRDLVVVAAVGLIPAIAGCEAGTNAPTQEWHQPTPGASAIVDNTLRINNMFVLGPTPGFTLPRGASAGLFFALSNDGAPDRLLSIKAPGEAVSVLVPAGGISARPAADAVLHRPVPRVVLEHLTRTLNGGQCDPAEPAVPERRLQVPEGPGDATDRVLRHLLARAGDPAPAPHPDPVGAGHSVPDTHLLTGRYAPRATGPPGRRDPRGARPGTTQPVATGGRRRAQSPGSNL